MLELYHASISTCSQKVRLCLAEKQLEWVDRRIEFSTKEHLTPEYLKLNPNGVVPTLVHDGNPVIDSSVICEYLDECFQSNGVSLIPGDFLGRARMRAWLRYIEEVPTTAIRYPSFNKLFKKAFQQMNDQDYADFANGLPLRKGLYQQFGGSKGFTEQQIEDSIDRLVQTVNRVDVAVAESEFIVGDNISLADICVFPTIVRMEDLELTQLWQGKTAFINWYERMKKRPSFNMAYYQGARVSLTEDAIQAL